MPSGNHPPDVPEQGRNRHNKYSDPWPVQRDEDGQHDERRAGADDAAEHTSAKGEKEEKQQRDHRL